MRELGQCGSHLLDPGFVDRQRRQIGIGEIAVVLRVFLAAHRARLVPVGIVESRLLRDGPAVLDQLDLAADLELDRVLKKAEAVEVLDLAARSELRLTCATHRDIGVATEASFLHIPIADADPSHEGVQRPGVGDRFLGAAHIGFGDDLQQRCAGAIEVDPRHAANVLVQGLAGVFLQVRACQPNGLLAIVRDNGDRPTLNDRDFVLTDLVALRQVGVEVVLAREDAALVDRSADRQSEADGALDRALVQYRQHARQRDVDRRRLGVRCRAERGRGSGENLRRGRELRVRFQPDDGFPLHVKTFHHHGTKAPRKDLLGVLAVNSLPFPARAGANRSPADTGARG